MFLKSFDLHGFKSFKDRTKLEFKDGITTIVGPNGSGKSNIADAFRWVLGEQKIKALRGAKGEDVIFGGTKVHKPLGVATVHMNIDNHDGTLNLPYEEVTIARKIYRSGESDYSINGSSCRLKDIHELFNDTGLGRDSFSIIGQGEIDRILNAKPEDRRGMIEELAGIVKYRNRKEESIRKIEHAELNLTRVLDIIGELKGSYTTLEGDARKAARYLELKERADVLELNLILNDIHDADLELEELSSAIAVGRDAITAKAAGIQTKETLYEQNQLELMSLEEGLKTGRNRLLELKDIIGELKARILTSENGISLYLDKNRDLLAEIEEIETRESSLELVYREKLEQKERWTSLKTEKTEVIREMEKTVRDVTAQKNSLLEVGEDIRYELIDIFQEIAVLHNEIKSVISEEESLAAKEIEGEQEKQAMTGYLEDLAKALEEKTRFNGRLKEDQKRLEEEIAGLVETKQRLETEKAGMAGERESLNEDYQKSYSRYRALQDIQKDYQGYYAGVKSVLQQRDQGSLSGICGVVGELIKTGKRTERAIEIALGGALQDILVERTEDAKKAISWLKREEKGRATFLPLDVVKPRNLKEDQKRLLQETGVLGIASTLVEVEGRYRAAIENLLGNTVIVENMDVGARIAAKSGQSLKLVTLEGEQFMPGGALTGGNVGKTNSVLSRNRVLEELKVEVDAKRGRLNALNEALDRLNSELYPLEGKIGARGVKLRELSDGVIASNQDLELRKQEIANIEEKRSLMEYNRENIREEIEGLGKEKILLDRKLQEKEQEKDHKEKAKAGKEQEVRDQDALIEKLNDEVFQERIALNSLAEKEKAFLDSLEAYFSEREDSKALIARKKSQMEGNEAQAAALRLERDEAMSQAREREQEYEDLEVGLKEQDGSKDDLQTANLELDRQIRQENKELKEAEEIQHGLEIREAKLDTDKSNKVALLQEKFDLLPMEAMDRRQPIEDRKADQKELKQLQQGISALGLVNLGAIEEFERVRERLVFLKGQEGDLRKSIDSLTDVIGEIDKIMTARFMTSFKELNEAFGNTYNALFGGGEAYIELTDGSDLLNSGIEIFSKPPGKTPKSLNMLSGGERALTALALLFSLLKIKPSPLCIIDEADASLDERNVVNFANYLKTYSDKTQFIVISHRQGTIEESDNLYGVTMDKSGVSKIISVSLEKDRRMSHA